MENLEFGNFWGDLREFKGKFWAHLERPRIWGRVWHHLRGGKKIKKNKFEAILGKIQEDFEVRITGWVLKRI